MGRKASKSEPGLVLTTAPLPVPAEVGGKVLPEKPKPKPAMVRAEWTDFVYLFSALLAMVVLTYTHNYELGLIVMFAGAIAQLLALVSRS